MTIIKRNQNTCNHKRFITLLPLFQMPPPPFLRGVLLLYYPEQQVNPWLRSPFFKMSSEWGGGGVSPNCLFLSHAMSLTYSSLYELVHCHNYMKTLCISFLNFVSPILKYLCNFDKKLCMYHSVRTSESG